MILQKVTKKIRNFNSDLPMSNILSHLQYHLFCLFLFFHTHSSFSENLRVSFTCHGLLSLNISVCFLRIEVFTLHNHILIINFINLH